MVIRVMEFSMMCVDQMTRHCYVRSMLLQDFSAREYLQVSKDLVI